MGETTKSKEELQFIAEKVNKAKLILSNLFARKQKRLIVDGSRPGILYFTNIEHDRISFYRPTAEDVLSKVQLSETASDIIYTVMPIFKKMIADIEIQKFCASFNKAYRNDKSKYPEIRIDEGMRKIFMIVPPDDKGNDKYEVEIGLLLTDHDPSYYDEIIEKFNKFSDTVIKREFRVSGLRDITEHVKMESVEFPGKEIQTRFGLPLRDGLSLVSFKEYVGKRKLDPKYTLELQHDIQGNTSKATIRYFDDWVNAFTIMPGSLWFMSRM